MLSRLRIIIFSVVGIGVFILMIFLLFKALDGPGGDDKATLIFWGVYDEASLYKDVIEQFHSVYPNASIKYQNFSFDEYENRLIEAFAANQGPDIWMMHNTWLPKHINKMTPMPETRIGSNDPMMLFSDFQSQFVDVVIQDVTVGERIYAAPLYVDTIALYYNKDMFNDAGITKPPETWEDFNDAVRLLT